MYTYLRAVKQHAEKHGKMVKTVTSEDLACVSTYNFDMEGFILIKTAELYLQTQFALYCREVGRHCKREALEVS